VHLGCFVDDPADMQYVDEVKKYCAETCFVPLHPRWRRICSLAALSTGESLSVAYYRNAALSAWIDGLLSRIDIRRVLVFSSVMAQYAERVHGATKVADMVDVDSAKWTRYAKDKSWPLSWLYAREGRTLLDFEAKTARGFDASVFVSEAEARLFTQLARLPERRIHFAANGVDTDYFRPGLGQPSPYEPNARVLAFTGAMDYFPNVDAVTWFANDIFPHVRARFPDVGFAIVGARPSSEVRRLGDREGIIVTGTVADVRPYLEHASAAVAPLRIARGIQNKVLEGMAMGLSVVATPDAAEGLEVVADKELLVARSGDDFVAVLADVLSGRRSTGEAARARVLGSYSWETNLARMRDLLETTEPGGCRADAERAIAA
jgi:sugar transferase (PEP-CTERM/EpsH1 system associated)